MTIAPDAGRKVLVSTMKNEGPYLLEWLAYHKSIGITDFCIFSNDCTDGTNLILNRLDQMGVVKHFDNPLGPRMDPQRRAYSRANQIDWVKAADWVLIVDADEFLNIHVGDRSINALIAACGNPDAISINWRLMGSQGQSKMSDELVTERYTRGSSFDDPENGLVWGFKTLFRPAKFGYFAVHRPRFEKDVELVPGMVKWTNAAGKPMGDTYLEKGWRGNSDNVSNEFAQVNHYAIKSREDFLLKRLRGTANSKNKDRIDMEYWDKYDINTHEDTTIMTDGIRTIIDEWMKDDDLAALTRACAECSQRVLDYQLTDPDFRAFVDTGKFAKAKDSKKNKKISEATDGSARFLCVGTHHKTGTVWLRRVLHAIKDDQNIPLMQCHNAEKIKNAADEGPQIIVNWESSFPQDLLALPHARFIHMIRDPRDVLLSGMRYHRKAPLGREKFLAEPRDDLGGKNYIDYLNDLPDDLARWQFEMRNKHAQTVKEMLAWDYSGNAIGDVRYEDLIVDVECVKIREILEDFAIEGLDIDRAVQSYWQNSLFGGVNEEPELGKQHARHITSGSVAQWKTQMPRALAEIYADEYGDALISLGYEDDKKWVKECPVEVKA